MGVITQKFQSAIRSWPTAVVTAYVIVAYSWTISPEYFPPKATVDRAVTRPMLFLGLWQAWDMFAPNPRSEDIWVEVVATNRDGTKFQWPLTKMIEMGYGERWQKERWRKYFNDHLRLDKEKNLWQPFTEYAVRHLRGQGKDPTVIELRRVWRPAAHPVRPDLRADRRDTPWNSFTFHRWAVPEGFGR